VLDAAGDNAIVALGKFDCGVAEFNNHGAPYHIKHFIFIGMVVPDKLTKNFGNSNVLVVERCNYVGPPMSTNLVELRVYISRVDGGGGVGIWL